MEYWTINTTNDKGNKGVGGDMMKRTHPNTTLQIIDVKSVDE